MVIVAVDEMIDCVLDEDYKTGAMLGEHDQPAMEASARSPLEIDASEEDARDKDAGTHHPYQCGAQGTHQIEHPGP